MREVFRIINLRCYDLVETTLTHEQTVLLFIIYNKKDEVTQKDIANITGKNKSTILRLTDALEEKDLVRRAIDKKDKRKNYLMITNKGQNELQKRLEIMDEVFSELKQGISEKDLQTFNNVVDHFISKAKTL